jgi:protein-S-isoprenylcysteine O-methyltransferase Ste14
MSAISICRALWVVFFAFWLYSGMNTKRTEQRESRITRMAHLAAMLASWALILPDHAFSPPLGSPVFSSGPFAPGALPGQVVGVAITAMSVAFAFWARITLGRNWSGAVTLKKDHELVRRGPYRWVRHPIYTGIWGAVAGTSIATAEVRGVIATVLVLAAYLVKLRKEERLLERHFPEAYPDYRRRTKRLIPLIF